jgi:hypothetical protein
VRGHQFYGNRYGAREYSLQAILAAAEPLRPFCRCGCGEQLEIPPFLLTKGKGIQSIQSYWARHPYRKAHGVWEQRTQNYCGQLETLSPELLGLIYGTLLGDGSISYPNQHSRFPRLAWTHSITQQFWLEHKATRLYALRPRLRLAQNRGYGQFSTCCSTACHPDLVEVFNIVKPTATRKQVNQRWLEHISPEGMAWWFMDDGSRTVLPSGSSTIRFHTEGYSHAENQLLAAWLTNRGFDAKVYTVTPAGRRRYWYLALSTRATAQWLEQMQPFAAPSMAYKF